MTRARAEKDEVRGMEAYFFGQRKAVPSAFAEWLAPEVSAAVSIDMHRGHLDDSPECPCPAPGAARSWHLPLQSASHAYGRLPNAARVRDGATPHARHPS